MNLFHKLVSAWRDRRGNVALTMAFALPVMAVAMGGSIDYGRTYSVRAKLQDALDNAVLASFGATTTPSGTAAAQIFAANFNNSDVTVTGPTFTYPTSQSISATLTAKVKNSFLAIAGLSSFDVTITSKAAAYRADGLATVTATTTSAQGAYDKQIYFFTKDKDGNVTSTQLLLDYDYTLNIYTYVGTKTYTPAIGTSKTISVSPYETYGYYMIVYQDNSYVGKRINPVTMWSDGAAATTYRHTTGDCSTPTGQVDNWEDGGDTNFVDFVITIKCTKGANGPLKVYLTQ